MKQKLKKLMKNKKAVALIALVLVLLICLILIKSVFFPGHGSKYGNRLDGINKISFTSSDKSSITKFISDNDKVTEAKLNIHGKIVNVIFNVKEDTSLDDAKKIASESLEKFSDDVKNFYDIEYIITKNDEKGIEKEVTDENGKTTTTSLINHILEKAGYNTFLGGNIGTPLFTKLPEMTPEDIVVLELSSFQLMNMQVSPQIAVMTNVTPNHLNIHKDYDEYIEAKKCIFKNQNEDDILILNYDNEITRNCAKEAKGKVIFFSSKEKLDNGFIVDDGVIKECEDKVRKHILNTDEVILRGTHNFANIATALAATKTLVDTDTAVKAIKEFKPVEHRIEFVREIGGVKWYNDSASSSPTRTLSGLNSFKEDIILIAGGYDKNLDYTPLAKTVVDKVKTLILIGQTAEKIFDAVKEELDKENKKMDIYMCDSLEKTIKIARKSAQKGEVVLFSPASASFDMFKNFADRGNKFKKLVNEI